MYKSRLRSLHLVLGLTALALPADALSQAREIVTKEVSVGRSEATLRLEFEDGDPLEISFRDGTVLVDGDAVGSFEAGGELEAAWRELLGRAVALEDGPLAEMLSDWTFPADLAGDMADLAREVDDAIEQALTDLDVQVDVDSGSASVTIDGSSLGALLLRSLGRLGVLEEALRGLDADIDVRIDEDVIVEAGSVLERTLVVIQGDVRVEGRIDGDVVVVGGTIDLRDGSVVTGQVRVADARVVRNEGAVTGGIVDVLAEERAEATDSRNRIRDEIRDEVRRDLRNEIRNATRGDDGFSLLSPFRSVARAVGNLFQKAVAILVLGLIGAGVIAFGGDKVDVIAETARRTPGRSAMVGMAGTLLLIPVWLLGTVALVVSIVGIPVAIAWLPLFPLAACTAAVVGYLAVARNAGEWLADSEYPWTGWIRKSNSLVTMVGGLVGLMFAFIAANVVAMAPFLGFLSGLLAFVGSVITFLAIQIGFGAVLLTRAGRRREAWAYDADAAWEAAMNVDVDLDHEAGPAASGGGTGGGA